MGGMLSSTGLPRRSRHTAKKTGTNWGMLVLVAVLALVAAGSVLVTKHELARRSPAQAAPPVAPLKPGSAPGVPVHQPGAAGPGAGGSAPQPGLPAPGPQLGHSARPAPSPSPSSRPPSRRPSPAPRASKTPDPSPSPTSVPDPSPIPSKRHRVCVLPGLLGVCLQWK